MHTFRKTLLKYGAPDCVYFDNGKQFRTHWMQRACGKLGIRLLYTRPYSPEAKGKQERYNQTADTFLREAQLSKPKTLEELNRLYQIWMEECYLHNPHSALEGKSPYEAYQSERHELRFLSADVIADAFLACEATPFTRSIPVDSLYMPQELTEVLNRLGYVAERQLFAVLTGDCGTGKTTILRRFSNSLDKNRFKFLYISDSKLTPRNFYRVLLEQMGFQARYHRGDAKRQLHTEIEIMKAVHGIQPVCVCDECHLLSREMLEEIRFLLNVKLDSISVIRWNMQRARASYLPKQRLMSYISTVPEQPES